MIRNGCKSSKNLSEQVRENVKSQLVGKEVHLPFEVSSLNI